MFNVFGMIGFGKKIALFLLTTISTLLFSGSLVLAQNAASSSNNLRPCPDGHGMCTLIDNPIASRGTDVFKQVGGVVGYVLLLIGSLTLLMIVWGGFQWLTAAGNAEKIEQGSKTMIWAVIGVFAVFVSYLFLNTYLDYLTGTK